LPQSEDFFTHIMSKAATIGLKEYEQDWICLTHMKMNATQDNVVKARTWMKSMDAAAHKLNMTVQLCMMYPRHVLQTLEMTSVTQARASTDYHPMTKTDCKFNDPNPTCTQYNIGLTSLFFSALGILPSKDNFKTSNKVQTKTAGNSDYEPNPLLQAVVAGLSGGSVGPSDELGTMDFNSVHHICRGPDGYLNKPSKIATPLDLTFKLGFDRAAEGLDGFPFVQDAYTEFSGQQWHYLLSVNLTESVSIYPADLGLSGTHVAFEYFPECWRNLTAAKMGYCEFEYGPGHTTTFNSSSALKLQPGGVLGDNLGSGENATPFRYIVTAPLFENGWALLGETGKFFSATTDRFSDLVFGEDGDWQVAVSGVSGEHVGIDLVPPGSLPGTVAGASIRMTHVRCGISTHGGATMRCTSQGGPACSC